MLDTNDDERKIYVVEQHNSAYDTGPKRLYAETLEGALGIAERLRESHHGSEWAFSGSDHREESMTFQATDASGWVKLYADVVVQS
jgi:hypothetical protein